MRKICIHWTAGSYTNPEKDHYHFTIGDDGKVYKGNKPPESNIPKDGSSLSKQNPSTYVAHCGGGNSYCIGVSMMGMAGYKSPKNVGNYPLTQKQFEATCKLVAELCKKYTIPITAATVFTHYEFGLKNPKSASAGKIDIVHLPFKPELKKEHLGDYFRNKAQWYLSQLK